MILISPFINRLIQQGLRVWIYSGDTDGAVPIGGSLYWISKLNAEQGY